MSLQVDQFAEQLDAIVDEYEMLRATAKYDDMSDVDADPLQTLIS